MIANYAINKAMKAKHRRTLESIHATPNSGGIIFADIEALIVALGGKIREGNGSRVALNWMARANICTDRTLEKKRRSIKWKNCGNG